MKTRSILFTTLCSLMLGMGFSACEEELDSITPEHVNVPRFHYVLNEGAWGANNANISGFAIGQLNHDLQELGNLYLEKNGKQMGDVANTMIKEGNNIYVVVSGSKYVAKLDLYCQEKARYAFPTYEGEPRSIAIEGNHAYVTQQGGRISVINIEEMKEIAAWQQSDDNLEGIVEKDDKLYVANAWRQEGSNNFIYKNELLVIDTQSLQKTDTITVVDNPVKVQEIDDKIYVISQGNYADVPGALQVINTQTNTSKTIINDVTKITEGHNDLVYGVRSTYDANWQLTNSFFIYNPKTDEVSETSFLKDAPSSFSTDAIYLLEVDEETGYIFVGTSDYVTNGTIYQFDYTGKLIRSFDSGGINPSTMIIFD